MPKRRIKKIWVLLFLFISLCLFIYSFINIIIWYQENKKTSNILDNIDNITEIIEIEDNENTEIIEPTEEISESNPYWDYIKMNLIDIDFTELKKINKETVGWILVKGTNINYPFVQTKDNDYYLSHSFDKSYNKGGWVFLDYRNTLQELDKNTIIYAHNRKDKSMFGSLKNSLNESWLNDTSNHIIKLSTEKNNTLWQIFSIYHIPTTNDYIQVTFDTDEEFLNFANLLLERSIYNFNTQVSLNDKILTLSTCHNSNEKLVVHAKLIKIETKN